MGRGGFVSFGYSSGRESVGKCGRQAENGKMEIMTKTDQMVAMAVRMAETSARIGRFIAR